MSAQSCPCQAELLLTANIRHHILSPSVLSTCVKEHRSKSFPPTLVYSRGNAMPTAHAEVIVASSIDQLLVYLCLI